MISINYFFTILGWFGGILGIRFYIDDMNTGEKGNKQASENETKLIIFTQINRLLMIVCVASFIFIIIYSLMYPDKPIPDLKNPLI
ncbi:MAG: hypothetical protein QNJ42_19495 [Crocosphaera sp.]|nr:hypothetical protein [Crocosphaera sp.]